MYYALMYCSVPLLHMSYSIITSVFVLEAPTGTRIYTKKISKDTIYLKLIMKLFLFLTYSYFKNFLC